MSVAFEVDVFWFWVAISLTAALIYLPGFVITARIMARRISYGQVDGGDMILSSIISLIWPIIALVSLMFIGINRDK